MTTSVPTTTVREATATDLEDVRAIYNHAVRHTDATLDTEEKTPEQMAMWLAAHGGRNAAVVAERDGQAIGYGTLSPFAARGGYLPSTEISIYIAPDAQGMPGGWWTSRARRATARSSARHGHEHRVDPDDRTVRVRAHRLDPAHRGQAGQAGEPRGLPADLS